MRLYLSCLRCAFDPAVLKRKPLAVQRQYAVLYNEDGVYQFPCDEGHQVAIVLQAPRFAVLAEVALQAIIDGYFREAISSFAAALERFYEYYLRVLAIKNGVSTDSFDDAWEELKSSSERQLGAFVLAYTLENRSAPLLPKIAPSRNRVVHKGEIPTEQKAFEFGQTVIDFIHPLLGDLKIRYQPAVHEMICRENGEAYGKLKGEVRHPALATDRMLFAVDTIGEQPKPEILAVVQDRKRWRAALSA